MDIVFFITELLHQKNEVSIPYWGTFSWIKSAAKYNSENEEFSPPVERLEFKSHSEDSESLAEFISSQKNISLSSAKYFISKFVADIRQEFDDKGSVAFETLGIFKKEEEKVVFEPSAGLEITGNNYGLNPVKETRLKQETPKVVTIPADLYKDIDDDRFDSEDDGELLSPEKKSFLNINPFLLGAIIIVVAALGIYFFKPDFYRYLLEPNVSDTNRESAIKQEGLQLPPPLLVIDTLADSNKVTKDSVKIDDLFADTLIKKDDVVNVNLKSQITYEIIGVAFNTRPEAENYVSLMNNKGIYAKIVDQMPGSKFKVSLGSFATDKEAQIELIKIKKDLNKDAWVARVKPKKTK